MIKLELTVDELNFILTTLGKVSYEQVAPLMEKLRGQAIPQVQQRAPVPHVAAEAVE